VCVHVDDFVWTGNDKMKEVMRKLGEKFGFGEVKFNDFVFCGRRFQRHGDGRVTVDMAEDTLVGAGRVGSCQDTV